MVGVGMHLGTCLARGLHDQWGEPPQVRLFFFFGFRSSAFLAFDKRHVLPLFRHVDDDFLWCGWARQLF